MSNLETNLHVLFSKLESFASSKTVIGEPITIGDTIILPLVDVSVGLGAVGQSQDGTTSKNNITANEDKQGLASGVKITPSAVIVVNQKTNDIQLVNVKNQDSLNKLIDMAPGIIGKIKAMFAKEDEGETPEETPDELA